MVFPVDKEKEKAREQRLKDVLEAGSGLLSPPSSTEELLSLLDKSKNLMMYMEQSNSDATKQALLPLRNALKLPELFGTSDTDVKMSVISCISEMMRITAPEPPYDDDVLNEFFHLFVPALACLSQNSTASIYKKAALILEVAAEVRFCVLMVELKLEKLILEMFQLFMKNVRSDHPDTVFKHMEAIMTLVIQESDDDISLNLLTSLLDSVRKDNLKISPASWKLGERVLKNVADVLKPCVQKAVRSSFISVGDYSEIVASMCENGSSEEDRICGSEQVYHADPAEKSPGTRAGEENTGNKMDRQSQEMPENESKSENRANKNEVATISALNDTEIRQSADDITKSTMTNGTSPNRNGETTLVENSMERLGPCQLNETVKSVHAHDCPETDELDSIKSFKKNTKISKKRDWKPNTRMLPDEGYSHHWDSTHSSEKIKDQAAEPPGSSPKVSEIGGSSIAKNSSPDGSRRKRGRPKKNNIVLNEDGNINSSSGPNDDFREARVKEKTRDSVDVSVKKEPDDTSYQEAKQDNLAGTQEKDTAAGKETDYVMTDLDKQLLGKKIKVWWPLDKRFYIGIVHSFDHKQMKHKILYTDGEEELLNLRRERWELIGDDVSADGDQDADLPKLDDSSYKSPKRRRRRKSESGGQAKTGSSSKRGRPPKKPKVEVDSEPINPSIVGIENGEKSKSTIPETMVVSSTAEDPPTCTGSASPPTKPASKDEDPQKCTGTGSKPSTPNSITEQKTDLPKPNASSDELLSVLTRPHKKKRNRRKLESAGQAETGSKPRRGRPPKKTKAEVDNVPESPVIDKKRDDEHCTNMISKAATPKKLIVTLRAEDPQKSTGSGSKTPIVSKVENPQESTGASTKPTTPDTVIVPKEREAALLVVPNASSYVRSKKKRNRKTGSVVQEKTDSPKKRGRPKHPKSEVDSETDNPLIDGKMNGEMSTSTDSKPITPEIVIESKDENHQKSGTISKPTAQNATVDPKERDPGLPDLNASSYTPQKKKRNRKSVSFGPEKSGTPKKRGRPPKTPKIEADSKPDDNAVNDEKASRERSTSSDSNAEDPPKTEKFTKPIAPDIVVECPKDDGNGSASSILENVSKNEKTEKD